MSSSGPSATRIATRRRKALPQCFIFNGRGIAGVMIPAPARLAAPCTDWGTEPEFLSVQRWLTPLVLKLRLRDSKISIQYGQKDRIFLISEKPILLLFSCSATRSTLWQKQQEMILKIRGFGLHQILEVLISLVFFLPILHSSGDRPGPLPVSRHKAIWWLSTTLSWSHSGIMHHNLVGTICALSPAWLATTPLPNLSHRPDF